MAVEQLHRVTGLRLGSLLGQPDDLLICGRREQDIESQVPEKCICHGEEFVDHQRIGDAHHLFPWDPDGVIPLQQQRPRPLVEGDVLRHPWAGGVFRPGRCVKSVEAGRAADRLQRQQGRSIGAADGETGRNREPLPQLLLKRSHNPGIVGDAALKHHAAPDGLGPNDLVEVVADNGPAQASRHLCLGGAPGECGLDGCLDKHRTPLPQFHRAGRAERQRAELLQWDAHARGLLFYKGAGPGGADPVHLKVGHLSAP